MNDPYNGNGRKSPEDDLGRSIEKEVKETIGTVAAALQDAAREVSTSLRDNESVQRTVKDLGAAARDGVQGIQSAIAQAQKNAEKEKRRRKRRDYAKKANGALSEAGGLMLPAGILAACAFSAFEPGDPAGALILGFISLWFFAGAFGAFLKSRTLRRIATYQSVLGERSYCTLQELSELTGKSQGAVRKDLFRLISSGKYEDVYLAPDGTRLFSGETAYRLYLAQRQAQQEAGARRQAQPARPEPAGVLAECRAFLSDLREQQRLISDAPVLEQVQRIEEQTVQIIAWLEKHPGGESQIRRFVSYYMPTTLKLLRTYNEVDPQADSSAVAAEIQTDICGILYTINTAFQSLQDNLLKDTAMDVSAEISALETVLAQEGLTKDELLGREGGEEGSAGVWARSFLSSFCCWSSCRACARKVCAARRMEKSIAAHSMDTGPPERAAHRCSPRSTAIPPGHRRRAPQARAVRRIRTLRAAKATIRCGASSCWACARALRAALGPR